jgi:peptidoglycan/xylan/chitin deacetylase (PgdA/CDA1 family)
VAGERVASKGAGGTWSSIGATGAVLMYHRVVTTRYDPWRLSVSERHFEQQLSLLSRLKVVPLSAVTSTRGGIAITFDDGYADNLMTALPLLQKYQLPATVFVATDAFSGREFWWDRAEHSLLAEKRPAGGVKRVRNWLSDRARTSAMGTRLRQLDPHSLEDAVAGLPGAPAADAPACSRHRMMSKDELRELAASPLIEIGAHTCSHPNLSQLSETEQEREIVTSREILEDVTGSKIRSFSYPYGAHDDRSVRAVKRAGFDVACIVGGGLVRPSTHPLRLPRLMVRDLGGAGFAAQLGLWGAARWFA